MSIIESDSNSVFSRLLNNIADMARSIFSVFKLDFGLWGAFHGNGQTTVTGLAGPHIEIGGLTLHTALKSGSSGMNPMSAAVLQRSNRELEGGTRNVNVSVHDADSVYSEFIWHKIDGKEAVLELNNHSGFDLKEKYKTFGDAVFWFDNIFTTGS